MTELFPGFNSLTGIAMIIVGFGFIIFVHELGHFLAAKMVGVKVTQFAIGFGPAIVAWRKGIGFRPGSTEADLQLRLKKHLDQNYTDQRQRTGTSSHTQQAPASKQIDDACAKLGLGETEYRLNWLPLGGYVKMLGQEDLDAAVQSDDERAFNRKPAWARAIVIVAGVTMNLIFGLIFFIIAFLHGVEFPPAMVGGVSPNSPAAQARLVGSDDAATFGLKPGDRILQIDDTPVNDFLDVAVNTALAHADHTLTLQVAREGQAQPLVFKAKPVRNPQLGLLSLGISSPASTKLAASEDMPLPRDWSQAGVKTGMHITKVGDLPITPLQFHLFTQGIIAGAGNPVPLTLTDDQGLTAQITLTAAPTLTQAPSEVADKDYPTLQLLGLEPVVAVGFVTPKSLAEQAGLQAGDLLARIDQVDWPRLQRVPQLIQAAKGRKVAITVQRDGQLVELTPTQPSAKGTLGFQPTFAFDHAIISGTLPNSPFSSLNLPEGSRILAINNTPVATFGQMQRYLTHALAQHTQTADATTSPMTAEVRYQLNIAGQPEFTRTVSIDSPWQKSLAQAGWSMPMVSLPFATLRLPVKADTPWDAAVLGVHKTHVFMMQTYLTLVRLFQQTVPVSGLHGPVGIVHAGTMIARDSGWPYVLFFFGIISVNLVVINLLPIPIADGGLLVFLAIEKIKGSPVHPAILTGATYAGLALIGGLFLMVTYFDIMRLVAP